MRTGFTDTKVENRANLFTVSVLRVLSLVRALTRIFECDAKDLKSSFSGRRACLPGTLLRSSVYSLFRLMDSA